MPWQVFWLIVQIITVSQGCLKCSNDAMAIKKDFRNRFLAKKLRKEPDLKKKLQHLVDNVVDGLSNTRIHPKKYMAAIDELTLGKIASHFKRFVNRITENDFEDGQLFNEVTWGLQQLVATFEEIMPQFTKLICSNDCGTLIYSFINCFSCQTRTYTCTKVMYCGERRIHVDVDEDLILDCALSWHKVHHGVKQYRFYRMVNGKQQLMASGTDSFLVKKMVNTNDTGRYQCEMLNPKGTTNSRLDFQVIVLTPVGKTTWFTRPHLTPMEGPFALGVSSREPPPQEDWTSWIVIGITGGLLSLIVVALILQSVFYYRHKNKQEEKEQEEEEEKEEEETEETVENEVKGESEEKGENEESESES